ncbi:MAG: type I-U CRISPR-associated protein Cas7 [Nitrospirae bacterium]|nr:type I-U CRISPR-associated protein Cas7 [Nitrospirota bacterium]
MNDDTLKNFDTWLKDSGPAALVLREHLMPVEGHDGVLFPATFAASEDKTFKGGYNIDKFPDSANVCLVDSVGSQANRIEPLLMKKEYAGLVPQIVVKAGSKVVNLLEAGHRAGDAIVRCSVLQDDLEAAFNSVMNGNAEPLAKIAPTSLVFGVWDSRKTQAKLPRLIDSKIRAYNVRELTRSAVYAPPVNYAAEELLQEPEDLRDAEGKVKSKHPFSVRGFANALASATHGGVIAAGGVRRDATLHLAALRLLTAGDDKTKTLALRRYILGIALTAFTIPPSGYLRQGCNLVLDPDKSREFKIVFSDGRRDDAFVTHEEAIAYATAAAKAFGINPDRTIDFQTRPDREVEFDQELAKKDLEKKETSGKLKKKDN